MEHRYLKMGLTAPLLTTHPTSNQCSKRKMQFGTPRSRPRNEAFSSAPQTDLAPCARPASCAVSFACPKPSSGKLLFGASVARRSPSCFWCPSEAMRSSITTYQESLSRLAGEVDEAVAEEVPVPMTPTRSRESAYTPLSSGRR
jgi:hypothetical protein